MAKKSKKTPHRQIRRVNVRGLIIFGVVIVTVMLAYFPIKALSQRKVRRSALEQAKEISAKGDVDLALRHLGRYLDTWPDDVEALEEQAKLLANSARSLPQFLQAAMVNDHLLRVSPDGEGRQETRRRIIRLYIAYGDGIRAMARARKESSVEAFESRYRAAVKIADQLIAKGAKDAESHRLRAMAFDGLAASGDASALPEAVREYEEALRLDPGDAASAERLALIDLEQRNDPAAAEDTLDKLLEARPDSVPVRLTRYRYFTRSNKEARSRAELEAAVALAPTDASLRAIAAGDALRRGDTADARRHLDAIPEAERNTLQLRMVRGMVEYSERNHDEAIDQWRKGLTAVGGGDQGLTWRLAYILIQLGRLSEARPLVAQYERLEGDDVLAMGRFLRALFEQKAGHPARAIEGLERARDKVSEEVLPEVLLALGSCYEAVGDETRAMQSYRRAAITAPRSPSPRRAIARMLATRSPQEAIDELERALKLAPNDLGLIFEVARLHFAQQMAQPEAVRQWDRFEAALVRAEKVAPDEFAIRALRADYLAVSGRMNQAVEMLGKEARGPSRKRPEAWLAYARGLERLGRLDDANVALEEAAAPDASGSKALPRVARARLLAGIGKAQAARDVLVEGRDKLPVAEQPELVKALGELLRDLGDRDGARNAYADWARLVPDSPEPGLGLLALAQVFGDDEAARLGLEAIRSLGADQEPYALAARALELLRVDRARPGSPSADRLDQADRLIAQLQSIAPMLPVGHLLQGMALEYRDKHAEAIKAYNLALAKEEGMTPALIRLVELLARLKRYDEIATLRRRFNDRPGADPRQQASLAIAFDRVSAASALKFGDSGRAEQFAAQIVDDLPDSVQARATLARLLDGIGKPAEAEAALRSLVDRRPADPTAWIALVSFQARKGVTDEALKTIERARTGYTGERPELLMGRFRWICGDKAEATRHYAEALARRPDDLPTLRAVAEFSEAVGLSDQLDLVLRRVIKLDPSATWATRALALRIAATRNPATWAEAWALIAPGASVSGDTPEDRLTRASILALCPDVTRRSEALPAMVALAEDLPVSNPVGVEARTRLGRVMLDTNRAAEAASVIAPVADDEARLNPSALALSAEALARSGRVEEARRRLDRLAALEPKSRRLIATQAWVLRAEGKVAEAAAAIEADAAQAESLPDGQETNLAYFDLLGKLGQPEAAERLARRVAALWPRHANLLARVQLNRGQIAESMASCRIALAAGSPREVLAVATSLAIARRDDPQALKEIDALFEEARARAPKTYETLVMVATLRHIQGRYEDEVALYREALQKNPPSVHFLNNMAWTLCEGLQRPKEALGPIEEAIRREGRLAPYLDTRGVILTRLGRYDEAIAELERSAKDEPAATSFFHLARAYLKSGKSEEYRRSRDFAWKAGFDPRSLDATDRDGLDVVMGKP